ncbi:MULTISPECIES: hypothetical protein [unclassified Streptomyces]|jgi:hypothetical protein|uniref:hypothetical protein n=1 Tax=unclassified Streptomyces TaxID=2593676 RepID=UPI00369536BB
MRTSRLIGASLAAAALVGTAVVAGTPAVAQTNATASSCTAKALETVLIRDRTSTGGTALGQLNKGETASSPCQMYYGGSYTACGITSTRWVKVTKNGITGYVVGTCVLQPA